MYNHIRQYLNNNSDTLSEGDMTFSKFFVALNITHIKDYLFAIRSFTKISKYYFDAIQMEFWIPMPVVLILLICLIRPIKV